MLLICSLQRILTNGCRAWIACLDAAVHIGHGRNCNYFMRKVSDVGLFMWRLVAVFDWQQPGPDLRSIDAPCGLWVQFELPRQLVPCYTRAAYLACTCHESNPQHTQRFYSFGFSCQWGCPSEAGDWMAMTGDCKYKTPFNKSVPVWCVPAAGSNGHNGHASSCHQQLAVVAFGPITASCQPPPLLGSLAPLCLRAQSWVRPQLTGAALDPPMLLLLLVLLLQVLAHQQGAQGSRPLADSQG